MSFAGNPMRYVISPEGGGIGEGKALSTMTIEFKETKGSFTDLMDFTIMGDHRVFRLTESPSSKDDLPAPRDEWSLEEWCNACFLYILGDAQLSCDYDITWEGVAIMFTAKVASPFFDWIPGENSIPGIEFTLLLSGNAGTPSAVDGVRCQVWKNGTEKIGEDYKPVDAAGCVKFEIQEYAYSNLLQALPPRFMLTMTGVVHHIYADYFLKYKTIFCDRIAGVFSARTYCDPDNIYCYAIAGGLNREDLVANNQSLTDYFNLAATKQKFLTWSPPSKVTDKFESHSLFFAFQAPSYPAARLKLTIVTTQGSMVPFTIASFAVQPWTVVECLAGFSQLGLSEITHEDIVKWSLYLVDGYGNIISDVREFVLDEKYAENTRYFRFRNSWGTYDSLRCTGVFETFIEHEREKVLFISDELETSYNTPGGYSMIKESQNFKANSGWLSRDYLNYLRDFMLSSDIYEVEDGRLLKCLLTSKKTSLFKDAQYNYSLAFEYERAYEDFFFQGLE